MKGLNVQKRLYSNRLTYMMKKAARAEDEKIRAFVEHVEIEAMKPNAKSNVMELYANLKGLLVKKQEVTHKIDGATIAEAVIRAERELREANYRVDEMQVKSALFSPDLRLLAGQGERADSQVRVVGTSNELERLVLEPEAPDNSEG